MDAIRTLVIEPDAGPERQRSYLLHFVMAGLAWGRLPVPILSGWFVLTRFNGTNAPSG
jgi:hypothetical protein